MTHTIPEVATEANLLFTELAGDLDINLTFPQLDLNTDFEIPPGGPVDATIDPISLDQLTSGVVDGTGIFDVMMKAFTAHIETQSTKGRISSADYAKVYLGGVQTIMEQSIQFLMNKDRSYWDALLVQQNIKLARAQEVRARADIEIAKAAIQQSYYEASLSKLKAYAARNEYAKTKMDLVTGYNEILTSEQQMKLIHEQVDTARAQTKETLQDGTPILGLMDQERIYKEAQIAQMEEQGALTREQVDVNRAQTKNTLSDGSSVAGILADEKQLKKAQAQMANEQYELARAQIRDTLSTGDPIKGMAAVDKAIKLAQKGLTEEQHDAARAQTKDTLNNGAPVTGIMQYEKDLKAAQAKLVLEQYESQRGQTMGTRSDGMAVIGLIGAQTDLYKQQVVSYKRDAETKMVKMVLDTWTARKTIDEGVQVPTAIDTISIEQMVGALKQNLQLT